MRTRTIIFICGGLLIIGIVFWPMIYRYEKVGQIMVRVNRVTGYAEELKGGQWVVLKGGEEKTWVELPPTEAAKIKGTVGLSKTGAFSGKLNNGSNWLVRRVVFRIIAKKRDGSVLWDRQLDHLVVIMPLKGSKIFLTTTTEPEIASIQWSVASAYGEPPANEK